MGKVARAARGEGRYAAKFAKAENLGQGCWGSGATKARGRVNHRPVVLKNQRLG